MFPQWSELQTEIRALISSLGGNTGYLVSLPSFLRFFHVQQQDPVVYLFMMYLIMISITRIIEHQINELLMNNELEKKCRNVWPWILCFICLQVFYLIFCRSVWHFPLRLDSQLYVEVVFNQIAPDYLEGLLLIMPGEQLDQDVIVSFCHL